MSGARSRAAQAATLVRLRREVALRRRSPPQERLRRLLAHAAERSPWYGRALRGLDGAPLDELPVLTRDDLVERFDELCTDPALRRRDLEAHVQSAGGAPLGPYRVAASSGAVGTPVLIAFDRREWAGLLAASVASRRLAGGPSSRQAKVASPSPWHLSAQLGASLSDPRRPSLRLPVSRPVPELAGELEAFGPDSLNAAPSMLAMLAAEQLAGRLRIAPSRVFAGGEILAGATRRTVREAWGVEPFDVYATTEAGTIAAECTAHAGMHVLADHAVVEVVGEDRRPVEPGTPGAAVLVTVLSSRTIPLIRYELSDRAVLATGPCPCGRPGPRIDAVLGRAREQLVVRGTAVHPSVLTALLDVEPVAAWQVVQRGDALRVLVVGPREGFDADRLAAAVSAAATGAPTGVDVVDEIRRSASGKAALFVVER